MDRGYVKLWRKTFDNEVLSKDHACFSVFIHFLIMAEWKPGRKVWVSGQQVELQAGQLTCGRIQMSKSCGISIKQYRRCLTKLQMAQIVAIRRATKFTIVTILNWDTYQSKDNNKGPQTRAEIGPDMGHDGATIKELKNTSIKEKIGAFAPPTKDECLSFFTTNNSTHTNALNFFDHFASNGWLVGGRAKMKDWQAAARKWIRNPINQANQKFPGQQSESKPFPKNELWDKMEVWKKEREAEENKT